MGAYPRERRIGSSCPSTTASTESSQGTWIGRSWRSQASAIPSSRVSASASSVTIGSPARLPLVSTSDPGPAGSPGRPSSNWCSALGGSITPSRSLRGATSSATTGPAGEPSPAIRRSSTIGRRAETSSAASASSTRAIRRAASRSATSTANGLSPRRFRARSRATATGSPASQARWYPPIPLTATMPPSASRRRACCSAASRVSGSCPGASSSSTGPQAWQATGWAWKRRSAGSAYSRAQSGQSGKEAMVVIGRS